jgi:uncharacterized protein YdcH (DUF465 family)
MAYSFSLLRGVAAFNIQEFKHDPKDFDPRFSKIMEEVDSQVEALMKQEGTAKKLGSNRRFWRLKNEKLKARGIEWRSIGELNSATFD